MQMKNNLALKNCQAGAQASNTPDGLEYAAPGGRGGPSAPQPVHICYQDPRQPKGGELVAVINLCSGMIEAGQRVTLLTPCSPGQSPESYWLCEGRLRVIRLRSCDSPGPTFYGTDPQAARNRLAFARVATKYLRTQFKPSKVIIHAHGFSEVLLEAGALRNHGYAVLAECHMLISDRAECLGSRPEVVNRLRDIESQALLANDNIVVHSREMAEGVSRICPAFHGTIHIWPCAIGADNFQHVLADESRVPTVIGVGRISPEKGWGRYLRAAKAIARRRPGRRVRFLLAGKTDDQIPARRRCRQELEELARNCEFIRLLIGPQGVWGSDRIRLIDRSSIAVIPSTFEPFGLTMAEAMARGKPVVSFLTSGSREILDATQPGPTAFGMVAEGSAESLAGCIEYLLDHPDQARAMGRNARAKANDSFRPDKIARQNLALYRACHERKGAKR